jgi:hypothetical protein
LNCIRYWPRHGGRLGRENGRERVGVASHIIAQLQAPLQLANKPLNADILFPIPVRGFANAAPAAKQKGRAHARTKQRHHKYDRDDNHSRVIRHGIALHARAPPQNEAPWCGLKRLCRSYRDPIHSQTNLALAPRCS